MQTDRNFIGNVATGLAGTLATGRVLGLTSASVSASSVSAIAALNSPAKPLPAREPSFPPSPTSTPAVSKTPRKLAPAARTYSDYRQLLDDPALDAVLISTPQHLHAEPFIAAMDAGKHVYIEKAMAFTVEQAKLMRAAYQKAGTRVVQVGTRRARWAMSRTLRTTSPQAWSARSPQSARTCTATPRTASRNGRARSIPT